MTIKKILKQAIDRLQNEREAEILLCYILNKPKSWLVSHQDDTLSQEKISFYNQLVTRRLANEPVDYITGQKNFFGRDFIVNSKVLIPRPETEGLVEILLENLKNKELKGLNIIDVGTGSGEIAITLYCELKKTKKNLPIFYASDISKDALIVAKKNTAKHQANINLIESNLLKSIDKQFDIIIANLPYIPNYYLKNLTPDIAYFEPNIALDGGQNGQELIKELIKEAKDKINPNGRIYLEIWHNQAEELKTFAKQIFPQAKINVKKDLADYDRYLEIAT